MHTVQGEFRRTMGLFATGVTVITAYTRDGIHGMTANAITSVSLDPLLVLVCIDQRARMCQKIDEARRFAINILTERQEYLARHFAGHPTDPESITFHTVDRVPVLPASLAMLICTVDRMFEGGDHRIILGRVDSLIRGADGERPLLYYAGCYHHLAAHAGDSCTTLSRIPAAALESRGLHER